LELETKSKQSITLDKL